jgi:hypothetical protein
MENKECDVYDIYWLSSSLAIYQLLIFSMNYDRSDQLKETLTYGKEGGALGAFNVSSWEMAPDNNSATEKLETPVVLQSQWLVNLRVLVLDQLS